jgi:hypothetical protein
MPYLFLLLLLVHCEFQEVRPRSPRDGVESRAGDVEPAGDYEATLNTVLQAVVTENGLVRYDLLRGAFNLPFRRVLKAVEDYDVAALLTHEERLAFWMNAYNVQMLQNIIETPGVDDIIADGYGDAFFKTLFRTAGTALTLDELEHGILRGQAADGPLAVYRLATLDPRLHVGINCAAVSCPRLRQRAFTAANVDAELEAAMRDFVNSPVHFRAEGDRLILSSLLDWFGSDFDATGLPAGDFLLRYMAPERSGYAELHALLEGRSSGQVKARPNVSFEYLWTVNRARE